MSTDLHSTVLQEIHRLVRNELDWPRPLEESVRLREELQLDSMTMVVIAVGLENRFCIRLAEEDAGPLCTVGDLVQLVERRVVEQGGSP